MPTGCTRRAARSRCGRTGGAAPARREMSSRLTTTQAASRRSACSTASATSSLKRCRGMLGAVDVRDVGAQDERRLRPAGQPLQERRLAGRELDRVGRRLDERRDRAAPCPRSRRGTPPRRRSRGRRRRRSSCRRRRRGGSGVGSCPPGCERECPREVGDALGRTHRGGRERARRVREASAPLERPAAEATVEKARRRRRHRRRSPSTASTAKPGRRPSKPSPATKQPSGPSVIATRPGAELAQPRGGAAGSRSP